MVFRRRTLSSPINSVKHFVPYTNVETMGGALRNQALVVAITRGADRTLASSVEEGSKIHTVFVELWLNGRGANATTQFTVIIVKLVSGQEAPTVSDMLNLGSYENKKNILYTTQGVLGEGNAQSIPVLRNWVSIPKGKQRFGLGDSLHVIILATGESINNCGIAIFKEYL